MRIPKRVPRMDPPLGIPVKRPCFCQGTSLGAAWEASIKLSDGQINGPKPNFRASFGPRTSVTVQGKHAQVSGNKFREHRGGYSFGDFRGDAHKLYSLAYPERIGR